MLFWIAAALLTLVVTVFVIYPITRAPKSATSNADYDKEIYRARISEIDSDLRVDRISADEAAAAKAEEGRRLIDVAKAEHKAISARIGQFRKPLIAAVVIFVPLVTLVMYLASGLPNFPDQSLALRNDIDPQRQEITRLLERAETRLTESPDDGRGWDALAPVYLRLGRVDDAITAYRNAIRLNGESALRVTSLGEALVLKSQGLVNSDARELFESAAKMVPADPKPKFYLAMSLGQSGQHESAINAWNALLEGAPKEAAWVRVATEQLNQQLISVGRPTIEISSPDELRGPNSEDIKNAGQMSAEDRNAMIEGMVASLAEKLQDNPSDEAG